MTTPTGWHQLPLSEFIVLQRGFDLPHRDRVQGRFKVLSSGEAHGWHNEGPVEGPGFVVGRATNIGRPTWSDEDYWPLNTVLYAKDFMGNDPKFAYYWFLATDLTAYNSGSVQPMLNRNYIANVPIDVPPVTEQRGIAATLGALDDKIESNRRIHALLWDLLEVEYVRLTSGQPESPLRTILRLEYGKSLPAHSRVPGPVPVFGSNGVTGTHNVPLVSGPAVVVGRKGSIGEVHWSHVPCFPIDTTFFVAPDTDYPLLACFFALLSARLQERNSDSAIPGLNREAALGVEVPLAPRQKLIDWAEDRQVMLHQLVHHESEIRILTELRDALLPELLSGRIRVPEAQESLAGVGA